ncbi:hypothetical protein OSM86_23565, partial [Escherichia coli]|nr:hypothetical protein [Escherichia coli]
MTDVLTLKENGLEVRCANVSCGYYNAHTDEEITVRKDLQKCLDFVEHLIEDYILNTNSHKFHDPDCSSVSGMST